RRPVPAANRPAPPTLHGAGELPGLLANPALVGADQGTGHDHPLMDIQPGPPFNQHIHYPPPSKDGQATVAPHRKGKILPSVLTASVPPKRDVHGRDNR